MCLIYDSNTMQVNVIKNNSAVLKGGGRMCYVL